MRPGVQIAQLSFRESWLGWERPYLVP